MSRTTTSLQLGLILLLPSVWPQCVTAEVTFLPPTPYLSVDDSPFDMSGLGTTFFLEDFEDGLIFGSPVPPYLHLNTPGPMTDSVDADDGAIDGFGNKGHSLKTNDHSMTFSNPPNWSSHIIFAFDETSIGFLPTVFGFAWTDGMDGADLAVHVTERDDRRTAWNYGSLMDSSYNGQTDEDRFIGFESSIGIKRVHIVHGLSTHVYLNEFEIDHVQFGLHVPEPSCFVLSIGAFFLVIYGLGVRKSKSEIGVRNRGTTLPPPSADVFSNVSSHVTPWLLNYLNLGC